MSISAVRLFKETKGRTHLGWPEEEEDGSKYSSSLCGEHELVLTLLPWYMYDCKQCHQALVQKYTVEVPPTHNSFWMNRTMHAKLHVIQEGIRWTYCSKPGNVTGLYLPREFGPPTCVQCYHGFIRREINVPTQT